MAKAYHELFDLVAYSPTGALINRTFEVLTGTHDVDGFSRDDDGHFVHELADGYSDDDPETVSIDNEVIYCDTNGDMWPESALTYKTEDGTVVRAGAGQQVKSPNLDLAVGLAVKAERIRGQALNLGESDWIHAVDRAGWNNEAQVSQLEAFVREMGLMPILAAYAQRVEHGGA